MRSFRQPRVKEENEFKLLDLARVAKVRAGGRRFKFRAVVIGGDKKGKFGVGVAKGLDVAQAMDKAKRQAQKNFVTIPLVHDTIPYAVEAKFNASRVILKPQRKGGGLVAGGPVRVICELAGIKNISAKFLSKTHNKLNNAMAAMAAFKKLRVEKPPEDGSGSKA